MIHRRDHNRNVKVATGSMLTRFKEEKTMAGMAAAPLSDGRLQVWVMDQAGNVNPHRKNTEDPNWGWTG